MRAIVLAGGQGRRLRPYTVVLPKPLMPLGEKPILQIVVEQLRSNGFDHLTFAVGYLAELIEAYFGDGSRFGVSIDYSREDKPLGTAGPIGLVDNIDDDFLVMNGDILTNLNYAAFMQAHKQSGAICTVASFQKAVPISLGVLELDDQRRVTGYIEKPTLHYPVSTGIYCFRPDVFSHITPNEYCDLPDLIRKFIAEDERVQTWPLEGFWLDIGRPEDYEKAMEEYAEGRL